VQFERANYQNRTLYRMEGETRWLTVPVVQRSQKERILDKQVDQREPARRKWGDPFATLRHAYREARHFGLYAEPLRKLLGTRWEKLVDIDQASLDFLREAFGIRTPLLRSSQLDVRGAKSELILEICRALGAKTLLAGMGGSRSYLDPAHFERHGIAIAWHGFRHPVYPQCGPQAFTPGLSALDLLFHCGPDSRSVLMGELRMGEPRHEPQRSRAVDECRVAA
jgi:hypothetical protein